MRRIESLDGLRGLSALVVVLSHCLLTLPQPALLAPMQLSSWLNLRMWETYTPLRLLTAGHGAVMIFFVLSGLVLSLPFIAQNRQEYLPYAAKRFCRIYLPYAFAIMMSFLLYKICDPTPVPTTGPWLNEKSWTESITLHRTLHYLSMTGSPSAIAFDNVIWSLFIELRISLVFPLLFIAIRRQPIAAVTTCCVISFLAQVVCKQAASWSFFLSFLDAGQFLYLFAIGCFIALHMETINRWTSRLPVWSIAIAGSAALSALTLAGRKDPGYLVSGTGAVVVILLAAGRLQVRRGLSAPLLIWLGRISYSLYLIHMPVLLVLVHVLWRHLPLWSILTMVPFVALLVAEGMHRMVEVPAIRLGHRLALLVETAKEPSSSAPPLHS